MNNHHQNARTTFHSRVLMVQRLKEQGMTPRLVAEQFGVSVSTVYKWLRHFSKGWEAALHDHSSRPHRRPRRLRVERVATMAALRHMRLNSLEIARAISLPVSSVTYEIRRLGLNKLSRLEPKPPVVRYKHAAPGDWEYLYICVDYHSRLAYTELLSEERAITAAGFLLQAADWLTSHGVKIRQVITDNGIAHYVRIRPYTLRTKGKA